MGRTIWVDGGNQYETEVNKMAKVLHEQFTEKEQRAYEIKECKQIIKTILNDAIKSNRSLDRVEQEKVDYYQNKLNQLEQRNQGGNKMKNDLNYELRNKLGNNEGLVNVSDVEYRAGVVTGDANTDLGTNKQHAVPVDFVQGVVMDAVHDNFLLGMVKVIQSENEQRITVADYMGEMKDLKEMEEIALEDFVTVEKELLLSRKGVATMVSRHLIKSANFDVTGHVGKIFSHSLAVTCENLVAKALDDDATVEANKVQYTGSLLKALVAQLAVMPESLRTNSAIVMNPEAYQAMLAEEDAIGRNLLDFQYDQSLRAKICGVPVVISTAVQGVFVGSLRDAVAVGVNVRSIEAEQLPRRDAVSFAMNAYLGSCVVLPDAVKKLEKAE